MDRALFVPYKAVGCVTDGKPFEVNRLGNDVFLTLSIGRSFQVFRADHLNVCMVSRTLDAEITAIQIFRHETFAAVGNDIVVFKRNRVVRTYREHTALIKGLLIVGTVLLSYDSENIVKIIDIKQRKILGELQILQLASISSMMHPATYLNKVLIGFSNGKLELWNIRSHRLIYSFNPSRNENSSSVCCIEQSPACDVVAVGYSCGDILLLNLKLNKVLFSFHQTGAVTSMSFRTDSPAWTGISPYLVSASGSGQIHVWRLGGHGQKVSDTGFDANARRGLVCSMDEAHLSSISRVHFLEGEPIMISNSADNSVKMWIFDQAEGHPPRLLRSREGHIAPPSHIRYYGTGGFGSTNASLRDASDASSCEIVSCGSGGDVRVFNTARESQNRELSQKIMLKKLGYDRRRILLPPAIDIDFCETRERDWGNMVSIHQNHSNAYTWKYRNRTITEFVLRQPSWKCNDMMYPEDPSHHASALAVSACGNFCVIGNKGGSIHRYNLQSGLPRGSYPASASLEGLKAGLIKQRSAIPGNVLHADRSIHGETDVTASTGYLSSSLKAKQVQVQEDSGKKRSSAVELTVLPSGHLGSAVSGLFIDAMNEVLVSAGNDSKGLILFWSFSGHNVIASVHAGSPVQFLIGYRDAGFVAAICEDGAIRVFDVAKHRMVRVFSNGHSNKITSVIFTPDGRRVLSSSLDGTVRVWDFLTARCLSWISLGVPITSMTLSPSGEFMSVTLEGKQGVYLYADRSLFETVNFWKEPTSPTSVNISISTIETATPADKQSADADGLVDDSSSSEEEVESTEDKAFALEEAAEGVTKESTNQRGSCSITLSAIPRAYWTTLFNMELIKARNKPKEAPKPAERAPFFLPTVHQEGSTAPSFPTPAEFLKQKQNSVTISAGREDGGDNENKKKRKRSHSAQEDDPVAIAQAIASMGSVWEDEDGAWGDEGGSEVVDSESEENDVVDQALDSMMGNSKTSSRIIKSRDLFGENGLQMRCRLADILMTEYPRSLDSAHLSVKEAAKSCSKDVDSAVVSYLKGLSPPAVDLEMRALYQHDEDVYGVDLLRRMLFWLAMELKTGRNFEIIQAYLHRFFVIYSETVLKYESLAEELSDLRDLHAISCDSFRSMVQGNLCILKVLAHLPIT